MGNYIKLGDNISLQSFEEPLKGSIGGRTVPVVTIGKLFPILNAKLFQRLCPTIHEKYPDMDGFNDLLKHFKPDHLMAVYRDEKVDRLYITTLNTEPFSLDGIIVLDEPFLDPLVKLGNSYIELLKTFISSAKVEGLVCLTAEEEFDLGLMEGDELENDPRSENGSIYLGCITDDPTIINDEAQILGGAYDLYLNKDEEITMVWAPYPSDTVYRGISTIIERLFDFSTLNPNNCR